MLNLNYIIASDILQIMVYIYKLKSFFFFFYYEFLKFYVYDEHFIKVSNFNYLAFLKVKIVRK